uniref:Uncharacterized protein n=1 Tax=Babesia bovis TaxID=5865 RepID=S6B3E0_BABBO|nr:conserved hypothetical protein [Babesia bovis]
MALESLQKPKRYHGRRYQFEPQGVSALYPFVAERVRKIVHETRTSIKRDNIKQRIQRRQLFCRLTQLTANYVKPESMNELEIRASAINQQLAILHETRSLLLSFLQLTRGKPVQKSPYNGIQFSTDPSSTLEDEEAYIARRNIIREKRKEQFLNRIWKQSTEELQRREQELSKKLIAIQKRNAEEMAEEEIEMLPCDRELLISGVYRCNAKSQAKSQQHMMD